MLARNRSRPAENGVTYGGVAVLWRESFCTFKKIDCPNPSDFEIMVCAESIPGHSRKMVVVACYLPPNYTRARAAVVMEYVGDLVTEMKRRILDPFIIKALERVWRDEMLKEIIGRKQNGGTRQRPRAQRLINLEIPVLVRSLKSSNVELG